MAEHPQEGSAAPAEENACRICWGSAKEEVLIAPCQCTGSLQFVHHSCLTAWLQKRSLGECLRCEVCRQQYSGVSLPLWLRARFMSCCVLPAALAALLWILVGGLGFVFRIMLISVVAYHVSTLVSTALGLGANQQRILRIGCMLVLVLLSECSYGRSVRLDWAEGDAASAMPALRAGLTLRFNNTQFGGAFHDSVVLLVTHSGSGTMGFIMNRPGDFVYSEQLTTYPPPGRRQFGERRFGKGTPKVPAVPPGANGDLVQRSGYGGPVSNYNNQWMALHCDERYAARFPATNQGIGWEGVYWMRLAPSAPDGGQEYHYYPERNFTTFRGYAGWGPGQLEREIRRGAWTLHDAPKELIFSDMGTLEMHEAVGRLRPIDPAGDGGGESTESECGGAAAEDGKEDEGAEDYSWAYT
eukprot:TRINITY_DN64841_c0_g1_i1.p1 TRINITY_DN64841_c0_g1~~TRINITY_DN64841_c0_g1_i1.p1  ORF type:complete len:443 (+),score=99.85 TRINITY_DN64841_c0_g1_i1:91-1329(+)